MNKKAMISGVAILLTSTLHAHPGHNPLEDSILHFVFSTDHGLWMVLAAILSCAVFYSFRKGKQKTCHA